MALPLGLKWSNRVACDGTTNYFYCQRPGHPSSKGRAKSSSASELRKAIEAHDAIYHSPATKLLPQAVVESMQADLASRPSQSNTTVHEVLQRYLFRLNEKERKRAISSATADDYALDVKRLLEHIPPGMTVAQCDEVWVEEDYIPERRATGKTGGNRIVRELRTLYRAGKINRTRFAWEADDFSVGVAKHKKRAITIADVLKWISFMNEPERSLLTIKLLTAARNQELYNQRIASIDFERGGWTLYLRVKSRGEIKPHWQPLHEKALAILADITRDRPRNDLIWKMPGTNLPCSDSSLRYRLAVASIRAGVACDQDKCSCAAERCLRRPHSTFSQLRNLSMYYLMWQTKQQFGHYDPRYVQQYVGHASVTMTERYIDEGMFAELGLIANEEKRQASGFLAMGLMPADRPVETFRAKHTTTRLLPAAGGGER